MFDGNAFGKQLSQERKKAGFVSADSLAKEVSNRYPECPEGRSTIAKWEAGKQLKTLSEFACICETMNVSADKLLFNADTPQISIYQEIGLTDPAINALRKLKEEDHSGRIMSALNKALSDPGILNNLATFIGIDSPEHGSYTAAQSPEEGFYTVTMSPDDYAQVILMHLNRNLEQLRTGKAPEKYRPQEEKVKQTIEELRASGRKIIERGEQ